MLKNTKLISEFKSLEIQTKGPGLIFTRPMSKLERDHAHKVQAPKEPDIVIHSGQLSSREEMQQGFSSGPHPVTILNHFYQKTKTLAPKYSIEKKQNSKKVVHLRFLDKHWESDEKYRGKDAKKEVATKAVKELLILYPELIKYICETAFTHEPASHFWDKVDDEAISRININKKQHIKTVE
jgi:hypothetical protein